MHFVHEALISKLYNYNRSLKIKQYIYMLFAELRAQ